MATCVTRYVEERLSTDAHIILYSDGCVSQNKNQIVLAALLNVLSRRPDGHIEQIFETGHSQMECDSMHAVIEGSSRSHAVGTPGEWISSHFQMLTK